MIPVMRKPVSMWLGRLGAVLAACLLTLSVPTTSLGALPPAAGLETPQPILGPWTSDEPASLFLAQRNRGRGEREALSEQDRQHLQQQYRKWQALPPEEQAKLRRRQQELERMPPESRRLYQKRFQQWQELPDAERQQLRRQLDNWDRLPPKEQEAIRRRFRD